MITLAQARDRATLTVAEAAALLGISRDVAYREIESGALPSLRLGRRILVPTAALMRLLGDNGPAAA